MSQINRITSKSRQLPLYVDILILHCDNDGKRQKVFNEITNERLRSLHAAMWNDWRSFDDGFVTVFRAELPGDWER